MRSFVLHSTYEQVSLLDFDCAMHKKIFRTWLIKVLEGYWAYVIDCFASEWWRLSIMIIKTYLVGRDASVQYNKWNHCLQLRFIIVCNAIFIEYNYLSFMYIINNFIHLLTQRCLCMHVYVPYIPIFLEDFEFCISLSFFLNFSTISVRSHNIRWLKTNDIEMLSK